MYICLCMNTNICMRVLISLYIYFRRSCLCAPTAPHPPTALLQSLPAPSSALIPVGKGGAAHAGEGGTQRLPQSQPGPELWGRGQGTAGSEVAQTHGTFAGTCLGVCLGGCTYIRRCVCIRLYVHMCLCVSVHVYMCVDMYV